MVRTAISGNRSFIVSSGTVRSFHLIGDVSTSFYLRNYGSLSLSVDGDISQSFNRTIYGKPFFSLTVDSSPTFRFKIDAQR